MAKRVPTMSFSSTTTPTTPTSQALAPVTLPPDTALTLAAPALAIIDAEAAYGAITMREATADRVRAHQATITQATTALAALAKRRSTLAIPYTNALSAAAHAAADTLFSPITTLLRAQDIAISDRPAVSYSSNAPRYDSADPLPPAIRFTATLTFACRPGASLNSYSSNSDNEITLSGQFNTATLTSLYATLLADIAACDKDEADFRSRIDAATGAIARLNAGVESFLAKTAASTAKAKAKAAIAMQGGTVGESEDKLATFDAQVDAFLSDLEAGN